MEAASRFASLGSLSLRTIRISKSKLWYRAVPTRYLSAPLATAHTATVSSRFSSGTPTSPRHRTLYAAEDRVVALLEAGALLGTPVISAGLMPSPFGTWSVVRVRATL